MEEEERLGYTPLLPTYSEVRHLLPIFDGVPKPLVTAYLADISNLAGSPQQPLDWSNPDSWIDERLSGTAHDLAWRIWIESNRSVNPRHIQGAYYFINRHELLPVDSGQCYRFTSISQAFLHEDPSLIGRLDEIEGMRHLLRILATKGLAKRSALLPEWAEYVRATSKYRSDRPIEELLRKRLVNLRERRLVVREGVSYTVTEAGLAHIASPTRSGQLAPEPADPGQTVLMAIRDYNASQAQRLRQMIGEMPPFQFEHLVRDLLDAMGYQDVTVTQESGDRGVDVVATVQFGITTIREVVQVKRHQGTINRPTIDQLRGALPYHEALRGTIITTGTFSKGCPEAALFPGAAPISLIDGDRLMDLLIEHGIGIHQRPAMLYEIDAELFAPDSEQAEIEEALIEDA